MGNGFRARSKRGIDKRGGFVRGTTKWRDWVRQDGSTDFAPERNRYHFVGGSQLSLGAIAR